MYDHDGEYILCSTCCVSLSVLLARLCAGLRPTPVYLSDRDSTNTCGCGADRFQLHSMHSYSTPPTAFGSDARGSSNAVVIPNQLNCYYIIVTHIHTGQVIVTATLSCWSRDIYRREGKQADLKNK